MDAEAREKDGVHDDRSTEPIEESSELADVIEVVEVAEESVAAPVEPVVCVDGLGKRYADAWAVRDLSFDVFPGQIFGFIGPNGAGKTTTLRVLATLLDPTEGRVTIDGLDVESDTEAVRRVIGFLPDSFGVYEGNTVEEYLEFFAGAFRVARDRRAATVRDVMTLTDLEPLRRRMVGTLSRGMRQRLCLARTLIHDPKVLLLDEPASALDPRARIELRVLMKELRAMGKTIIISSHILTELSDVCDSVAIIERGQLADSGDIGHLQRKRRAGDRVRIQLLEEREGVEEMLAAVPEVALVRVRDTEVILEYTGAPARFHRVVKMLADAEVPFLSIQYNPKDLEDLFLELTQGEVQ